MDRAEKLKERWRKNHNGTIAFYVARDEWNAQIALVQEIASCDGLEEITSQIYHDYYIRVSEGSELMAFLRAGTFTKIGWRFVQLQRRLFNKGLPLVRNSVADLLPEEVLRRCDDLHDALVWNIGMDKYRSSVA